MMTPVSSSAIGRPSSQVSVHRGAGWPSGSAGSAASTAAICARSDAGTDAGGTAPAVQRVPSCMSDLHRREFDVDDGGGRGIRVGDIGDAADGLEVALGSFRAAIASAGAAMVIRVTAVFCEAFASVLARRMPMSASLAVTSTAGSPSMPSGSGHDAVCTEPSLNQDHGSSVAKTRTGAKSRRRVESAIRSASAADAWPTSVRSYARSLTSSR